MKKKTNKIEETPKAIYLDLGSGQNKSTVESLFQQGIITQDKKDIAVVLGVEQEDCEGVDIKHDLTKFPYPFEDESIDGAFSSHFIEHLDGPTRIKFFNEMYRILKPNARMRHIHPHYRSVRAIQDPTHCFSEDTDVLTESGWKKISNVAIGENILTLNQNTRNTELSPCINVINDNYEGDMVHFKNISMDCLVTPNHDMGWWTGGIKINSRWHVSQASTFLSLKGHHSRRADSIVKWEGIELDEIEIPLVKYEKGNFTNPNKFKSEDFMSFIGWYISEGCAGEGKKTTSNRVCISQSQTANAAKCFEIESLVKRMGFECNSDNTKIRFASKSITKYTKPLGNKYNKYIPFELKQLSPRLLDILLKSAIRGDERKNGSQERPGWEYMTTSKRLADDIMEIALKIGYRVSMSIAKDRPDIYVNGNSKLSKIAPLYTVGISQAQDLYYPKAENVKYSGKISCITVKDNNIIMVRRNGRVLWSGNCWPPIAPESYMYWDRNWREANKLGHYLGNCHYEIMVYNAGFQDPIWNSKVKEQQDFAIRYYNDVVPDLIADMIKK